MNKFIKRFGILGALLVLATISGCIVSATFVIDELFYFIAMDDFYFYQVDLTTDEDWQDNKDKIDLIDAVGVVFYYTSSSAGNVTFDAYIDDHSGAGANPESVPTGATAIIEDFTVSPGEGTMSYAQSLSIMDELDELKRLAKVGKFDFYVTSTGTIGTNFVIDSARVVVTLTTK